MIFNNLNFFDVLVYLCIFAASCILHFKLKKRDHSTSKLSGPPTRPFFGNELEFLFRKEDIFYILTNYAKKFGSRYQLWLRGESFVVLTNAEDAEEILGNGKYVEKGVTFRNSFGRIFGHGTFTSEAHIWKEDRRLLQFPLKPNFLNEYTEAINTELDKLMEVFEQLAKTEETFDAVHYVAVVPFNVFCKTMLETDTNVAPEKLKDYAESSKKHIGDCFKRLFLPKVVTFFIDIFGVQNYKDHEKNIALLYYKLQEEGKLKNKVNNSAHNVKTFRTLISCLLDEAYPQHCLKDNIMTYTVAATDTMAVSVSFVLLLLGIYQDVQEKIHKELCSVLGHEYRHVTVNDVKNLTYLDQVIKEVQRLFPLTCLLIRYLPETTKFGDCMVPGRSNIMINVYGIQHDARYFSEPEEFRPERFSAEKKIPKGVFMPFSMGPRDCVGKAFAKNELRIICARILHRFHIKTDVKKTEDIKLECHFMLTSADGYKISVSERK